ncbi:MAG: hypothetical protein FWF05_01025 [Oscillospiraceae bacterium]|nr:hypothetical protein [Oscillospiraceae bacterium]
MKKSLLRFAALVLAFAAIFTFAACRDGGGESTTAAPEAIATIPDFDAARYQVYRLEDATEYDEFHRMISVSLSADGTALLGQPPISSLLLFESTYSVAGDVLLIHVPNPEDYGLKGGDVAAMFTIEDDSTLVFLSSEFALRAKKGGRYVCESPEFALLGESASGESESESESTAGTTTAASTTTKPADDKSPKTAEEILDCYNKALERVAGRKTAFSKTRQTVNETYSAELALRPFKSLIYQFMGMGGENVYTAEAAKNDYYYSRYIRPSTLTEDDITSASCGVADGDYVLTIKIKDGQSSVTDGGSYTVDAPLDRSGISAGEGDKAYFDHKTAENIYDAISEVAGGATIKESYSGAAVNATIDPKTGNLKELTVTFGVSLDISQMMGSSASAAGSSTVEFRDFKW